MGWYAVTTIFFAWLFWLMWTRYTIRLSANLVVPGYIWDVFLTWKSTYQKDFYAAWSEDEDFRYDFINSLVIIGSFIISVFSAFKFFTHASAPALAQGALGLYLLLIFWSTFFRASWEGH